MERIFGTQGLKCGRQFVCIYANLARRRFPTNSSPPFSPARETFGCFIRISTFPWNFLERAFRTAPRAFRARQIISFHRLHRRYRLTVTLRGKIYERAERNAPLLSPVGTIMKLKLVGTRGKCLRFHAEGKTPRSSRRGDASVCC